MTERISKRLGLPVQATTFHKLGLDIISAATGKRPNVADDLAEYVRNYFEKEIVHDSTAIRLLIEYFAYYLTLPPDMNQFDSLGAAYAHEKSADMETLRSKYRQTRYVMGVAAGRREEKQTLKNERVKSMEEVQIANFLFLHGVNYEYESPYPIESADDQHRSYHPDFYLPDYDIYLEHFGINRNGKLPWLTPVEEAKYIDGMRWKRELHKTHGTTLLETYSYLASEGTLLQNLERMLKEHGVTFKEPDFADIFNSIYKKESDKYFTEFVNLCCTFIVLFKSEGYREEDTYRMINRIQSTEDSAQRERTSLFLQIVFSVLHKYNDHLQKQNSIDFADMINQATDEITSGYRIHKYRWVIVDEYQDISMARHRLVNAILTQTGAKLLCVGDDWQSIYRFAGSDIDLFTRFEHYFGPASIMRIEKTYRNSQQLIDVAGRFVSRNPSQITKNLRSAKSLDYPITFLCYSGSPNGMLKKAIDKIIHDAGEDVSILLLGRTTYDKDIPLSSGLFRQGNGDLLVYLESPKTSISFLTVHRSKGLEADYVILLNFENSTLGFPNKITDDPVLSLVLVKGENYPYAEERRLLYVALTRTRNRIFILVNQERPSVFLQEFHPSKSVFILNAGSTQSNENEVMCPRCKEGKLVLRRPEHHGKPFLGCSNYPQCDYTVNDVSVLAEPKVCPSCGGFLIKRRGGRGFFYGCSNYPFCTHTEEATRRTKD